MASVYLTPTNIDVPRLTKYLADLQVKAGGVPLIHAIMQKRDRAYNSMLYNKGINNFEYGLPTAFQATDTLRAQLAGDFVTNEPLFQAVGGPELDPIIEKINGSLDAQAKYGNWRSNISTSLLDAVKYDMMATQVTFKKYKRSAFQSNNDGQLEQVERTVGYNELKRLNLYNCTWDTTVPFQEVTTKGDFFAHSEIMSFNSLMEFIDNVGEDNLYHRGFVNKLLLGSKPGLPDPFTIELFGPATTSGVGSGIGGFYRFSDLGLDAFLLPGGSLAAGSILTEGEIAGAQFAFDSLAPNFNDTTKNYLKQRHAFLSIDASREVSLASRNFIHTVKYFRAIPKIVGVKIPKGSLLEVPSSLTSVLLRADIINSTVVLALSIVNDMHGMLPVVCSRLLDDGQMYNYHSYQERVEPYQKLGSELLSLEISAMRRSIIDRAIIDPDLIDPNRVTKSNSSGKYLLKKATGLAPRDITRAYFQIPFENVMKGQYIQSAITINSLANDLMGQNKVVQGGFVPGNKTDGQFQATLQSGQIRQYPLKITLEDWYFQPIKTILKYNILEYRNIQVVTSSLAGDDIQIPPELIDKIAFTIQVGDGLESPERLARMEQVRQEFATWIQTGLGNQINLVPLLRHLATNNYAKNFSQFAGAIQPAAPTSPGGPPTDQGSTTGGPSPALPPA
jgi:hypothetical protein